MVKFRIKVISILISMAIIMSTMTFSVFALLGTTKHVSAYGTASFIVNNISAEIEGSITGFKNITGTASFNQSFGTRDDESIYNWEIGEVTFKDIDFNQSLESTEDIIILIRIKNNKSRIALNFTPINSAENDNITITYLNRLYYVGYSEGVDFEEFSEEDVNNLTCMHPVGVIEESEQFQEKSGLNFNTVFELVIVLSVVDTQMDINSFSSNFVLEIFNHKSLENQF